MTVIRLPYVEPQTDGTFDIYIKQITRGFPHGTTEVKLYFASVGSVAEVRLLEYFWDFRDEAFRKVFVTGTRPKPKPKPESGLD